MRLSRNQRNAIVAVCAPLPALAFYAAFLVSHGDGPTNQIWARVCTWSSAHPIGLLNLLFFFNISLLFWVISLVQRSTWLIDLYWTVLPVLMAHFFAWHPHSKSDPYRSRVTVVLTWTWSARLTHSYFRREDWQWGEREDWRFAKMRKDNPKHWWWLSLFVVYLSQQCFLVGICLPLYAVHNSTIPWGTLDVVVSLVCALGVAIGYVADTQLYCFVRRNVILKQEGASAIPVLDKGLWHYSRHPNYFGEQLWWWGLAGYSCIVGQGWAIIGTIINSAVLAQVTVFVEDRMTADDWRFEAYKKYQQTTSTWIPWCKRRPKIKSE